jgi:hypothetical protein
VAFGGDAAEPIDVTLSLVPRQPFFTVAIFGKAVFRQVCRE